VWNPYTILAAALLILAATAAPDPAAANPDLKAFGLEYINGHVELLARARHEDRTPKGGRPGGFTKDEVLFDEILHLGVGGFVYHPNLMRIAAGMDLKFLQDVLNSDSFILPSGNLRLDFLQQKPYGLSLFGSIAEQEVQQRFGPTFGVRTLNYGGAVRFHAGPLPWDVTYRHYQRDQSNDPSNELSEVGDTVAFRATYEIGERSQGNIRYDFIDEVVRRLPLTRHDFFTNNTTYFGSDRRKKFSGVGRALFNSGRNNVSTAGLFGTYDWEHSETLSSKYHFDYQRQGLRSRTSDNYRLSSAVSHLLYGSLGSTLSAFGTYQDASFGSNAQYGGKISERYGKQLGDWGGLSIGFSPFARVRRQRPTEKTGFNTESVEFLQSGASVQLEARDIDEATIRVRHPACAFFSDGTPSPDNVCEPITDYFVDPSPDGVRTEIRHAGITSRIPINEEVLVDYDFLLGEDEDTLVYGYRNNAELRYNEWGSVFFESFFSREKGLKGTSVGRRRPNSDRQALGVRLNRGWVSARAVVDRQVGDQRSSIGNQQVVRLSTPWPTWWSASFSANHSGRDWDSPSERMERWGAYATMRAGLKRWGWLEVLTSYEKENWKGNDTEARDFDALSLRSSWNWRFRRIDVRLEASIFYVDRRFSTEHSERVFLRLRRYF
jgi:hypothetical protein